MDLSIVIPHYGDPAPTAALLDSLAPQCGDRAEIIVSDDHSPIPFPHQSSARVVRRHRNGGFAANCNTGASMARGQLLLFLNSDVTVGPTFVDDLLAAAEPFQPCVAAPRIVNREGEISDLPRRWPTVTRQAMAWFTPWARWRDSTAWERAVGHDSGARHATGPYLTEWVIGAAVLIPREDFEAVGGFDERFFMNSEEIDLQLRLCQRGLPVILLPTVTITHVGGGSSDSDLRKSWLVASQLAFARKWGYEGRLRTALTVTSLGNLVWNSARSVSNRDVHPLRTLTDELSLIHQGEEP